MCFLSMVIAQGQRTWPYYPYQPTTTPYTVTTYPPQPTAKQWEAFEELLEKARKYDEITGQADCEDPEKVIWLEAMRERLVELEERDEELSADQLRYLSGAVEDVLDDLDGVGCGSVESKKIVAYGLLDGWIPDGGTRMGGPHWDAGEHTDQHL